MENQKQRHGCLTALLVVMIIINTVNAAGHLLLVNNMQKLYPKLPLWGIWILALMGILNVLFALSLFRWKKWGFYGFGLASLVTSVVNVYGGVGYLSSILNLGIVAILYGVLQIGSENKGWPQLE